MSGMVALEGAVALALLRTRPTLLRTLELRFSVLPCSSVSRRRRKHTKKMSAASKATPASVPITMPAMAPPDNESDRACGVGVMLTVFDAMAGAVMIDVTYFVVAAPLIVTTDGHTLVDGSGVDDSVCHT